MCRLLFSAGSLEPYPASVNGLIGLCEKDRWMVDFKGSISLAAVTLSQCLQLIVNKFIDCNDSDINHLITNISRNYILMTHQTSMKVFHLNNSLVHQCYLVGLKHKHVI